MSLGSCPDLLAVATGVRLRGSDEDSPESPVGILLFGNAPEGTAGEAGAASRRASAMYLLKRSSESSLSAGRLLPRFTPRFGFGRGEASFGFALGGDFRGGVLSRHGGTDFSLIRGPPPTRGEGRGCDNNNSSSSIQVPVKVIAEWQTLACHAATSNKQR